MIKVGVTENVVLANAEIVEKNGTKWLTVIFTEGVSTPKEKKELSAAAMLSDASDSAGESSNDGTSFGLFMPNMKAFGTEDTKEGKVLLEEMIQLRAQLTHILKRYTTETNIRWNLLEKTSINQADDADLFAKLQIPAVYEQVYMNLCNQFIAQAKRFLNVADKPCRILLVRQSAAKSFGTFRKKFLTDQPFLESMDIPKNLSKLLIHTSSAGKKTKFHDADGDGYLPRFTDYELNKGLDNPIRIEADADASETSSQEGEQVSNLFSAGAAETAVPSFSVQDSAAA